ncbi:tumor necrosis factor receptor superfamily member 27 isoform X2 [Paroedura picta]|uniref:tumor necrosis factor receptor superfamily member 27 isoform X2 n=1 Tax=Paroedura picta TaxID=143630 RepID=UPI0040567636
MRGAALLFALMLATEAAHPLANPVECQASEYLDDRGKCAPCRECGPGLELSKECGYGEGGDSQCVLCRPRRFKENWGHHGCKPCLSCTLINRIQKSQCTASLNAVCGACFPGFYSKTQIGGLQDLECVPCTEQTPPSEPQCRPRVTLEKAGNPAGLTLDKALVVFTSSALLIILLVSLLSLLYCQRFWKSQCQRGLLRREDFSGQRVTFQASAGPAEFFHHEQLPNPSCLTVKSASPCHGSLEGNGLRFPLPARQADWGFPQRLTASPKVSPLETRNSGCSDSPAGGSSCKARDSAHPAPLSSCATERKHPWPHAPVECTELDLQDFSTQDELRRRGDAEERNARGTPEVAAEARLTSGSHHSSCSSFRSPTAESGEQRSEDARSLGAETGD